MTRATAIGAESRAVVPLTCLIVSSLEDEFAQVRMRTHAKTDALAQMHGLLSGLTRTRADMRARALLRLRQRSETLERAASIMGDIDLDAAWRAALRGDDVVLSARLLPHVRGPRATPIKGSPWRGNAWLTKR